MQTLLTAELIAERVAQLGRQITDDYHGQPLTVLGVLTGSIVFLADLIRRLELPLSVGLIQASSYRGEATRPGELNISTEMLPDIRGRDVLLVDDIFDTGHTLAGLLESLLGREPASLRSVVLLRKTGRGEVDVQPDYCGFDIPDVFVVGYGLDYAGQHRHLPYIAELLIGE